MQPTAFRTDKDLEKYFLSDTVSKVINYDKFLEKVIWKYLINFKITYPLTPKIPLWESIQLK